MSVSTIKTDVIPYLSSEKRDMKNYVWISICNSDDNMSLGKFKKFPTAEKWLTLYQTIFTH
jgi:hypothetical protein